MRIVIDGGTWSWHIAGILNNGHGDWWTETDKMIESGALLCCDSHDSLRRKHVPMYKANRKNLPPSTMKLKRIADEWTRMAQTRYQDANCLTVVGLEADDVVALIYKATDMIISRDKDFLTLPDAYLVTPTLIQWGIERQQAKTKVPLAQGERWLAYQILTGDAADGIPRLVHSKDRNTINSIMTLEHPLDMILQMFSEDTLRDSLNCLLLPTPLYTGVDPIDEARRRYL